MERLITWRWAELPIKGAESEEDAIEDDVMTGIYMYIYMYTHNTCTLYAYTCTCTVHV